jgi:adenylate cyclase
MLIPSLVLAAAMEILQVPHDDIIIDPGGSIILGTSKFEIPIRIPIDKDGYFFMNYVPDWLEYFDVRRFVNQLESTEQFPQEMSEGLKGKSVLVGGVLSLTDDFVLTPVHSPLPGAVVILNAINNILTRQFITIAKDRIIFLFIFVLPLLLSGIYLFKKPVISVIVTALLIALPIVASFRMFMNFGYYLPVGLPLLALIVTALLLALVEHFRQYKLTKNYSDILSRFVSPALMQELQKTVNLSALPGVRRVELSVMFIDIAGFTSLTQHSEPEEISTLLDDIYETTMQELVCHQGTLDKFIGDGLLAYFGAPKTIQEKEKQAARAALAIRARIEEANNVWNKKYGKKIQMRCGIATGYVTVGYFGGKKYATHTIIGKSVNLAARLEASAKVGQILVDSHTATRINNDFILEQLDPIRVKGITYPVNSWDLVREK